ncbi:MAG: thioredoxin domain-containing protein [Gammaproteobacteria bacterium]|nr:thioredoxin domain-containing protein [Gammaproteobacteria bacterium]
MASNRLADASSPYLLQHAKIPVHWQPWDEEALTLAKREDKPILLSIGYSACHWCHVMAHESFEDQATAALMNEFFVNIKVDREERPDLDQIYQSAHQLLAQRPGGWPLTLFLTPDDQTPFFAGTYFPREARHGLPSFTQLLRSITSAYVQQRAQIMEQNQTLQQALATLNPQQSSADQQLNAQPIEGAYRQLLEHFDELHGGFGKAPKFPHPSSLVRLLRHWSLKQIAGRSSPRTLHLVDHTLTQMALGGVNDQLGGGLYRYSTDDAWMIPHFEKMLYDNGPLLGLYADLWQTTQKSLFRETAQRTAEWVMREMQSPAGGYYSSLDADSEGGEGSFYLWSTDQVRVLLNDAEYRHLVRFYGLDRDPNFEGRWHLHGFTSIADLNQAFNTSGTEARALLDSAREKLFSARASRIRPDRDEKILTSWNALMIKGMARAGRLLAREDFIRSADQALCFIRRELWVNERLLASHAGGQSHLPAYLDDYAFLIDAILELLQTRWNRDDLNFAILLAEVLLHHFYDPEAGGFFFTADDHEQLFHRPKPFTDNATPSGNGIAASVLVRLGHLLGEGRYLSAAERTLQTAWARMIQHPSAHCSLLDALEEIIYPSEIIVIRGAAAHLDRWRQRASAYYAPQRYTLAVPAEESQLPGLLAARTAAASPLAYICRGEYCECPFADFSQFDRRLSESECRPPDPTAGLP